MVVIVQVWLAPAGPGPVIGVSVSALRLITSPITAISLKSMLICAKAENEKMEREKSNSFFICSILNFAKGRKK